MSWILKAIGAGCFLLVFIVALVVIALFAAVGVLLALAYENGVRHHA